MNFSCSMVGVIGQDAMLEFILLFLLFTNSKSTLYIPLYNIQMHHKCDHKFLRLAFLKFQHLNMQNIIFLNPGSMSLFQCYWIYLKIHGTVFL